MIPVGTNLELKKLPTATLAIIGVNILVFAVEAMLPSRSLEWVFQHFAFSAYTKNPFSPITAMFLHGDIFHIVGNMLFLWIFGGPVENRVGTKAFIVYYFGAGLWSKALWVIMTLVADPLSTAPVIGASGAISGMIALYLYRCFHSKLKMVLDPLFFPFKINIPAAPIIIFWFYLDVRHGIASLSQPAGVAYWGHVGGFLFGLAVGRVKKYGHEGRLEHLRDAILKKLEGGGGWQAAEKELLKLLRIAPRDAEVHHELARLYADKDQSSKAEERYQFAIQQYFLANPLHGAFAVLEHFDALKRPMAVHYHLKAAEVLASNSFAEDAYRALLPVIKVMNDRSALMERAMALFIKLSRHLDKKEEAGESTRMFQENFPGSKYGEEIRKALAMKPGELFPKKASPPTAHVKKELLDEDDEGPQNTVLRTLGFSAGIISDPLFLLVWILTTCIYEFGLIMTGASEERIWQMQIYVFLFAFAVTAVFRTNWLGLFSHASRRSEETAREEVDVSMTYNRAVLAEWGEDYPKAAELYEKVLAKEPDNVQARFNLARIYHHRLTDMNNALRQYRKLIELLPPEHPFHRDAQDVIQNSISAKKATQKN
ncbi:MAG: rhomboid family intramembrane serine protease [Nitrospirota bacterium]